MLPTHVLPRPTNDGLAVPVKVSGARLGHETARGVGVTGSRFVMKLSENSVDPVHNASVPAHLESTQDRAVHLDLEDELTLYNENFVGVGAGSSRQLRLRDETGRYLGGLSGAFWGTTAWLHVLWVGEESRRQGHGATLLAAFEEAALEAGCRQVLVSTYSFQAVLAFYTERGYRVLHTMPDVPTEGSELFHLSKSVVDLQGPLG